MKFLVADDHPLYREAVTAQLQRLFAGAVIEDVASLDEVRERAALQSFDLFLIDFYMPGMSLDKLAELVRAYPDTPVAIISGAADSGDIRAVIEAGARGFIPKTATGKHLAHAVELLLAGGSSVPADLLLPPELEDKQPSWPSGLTSRELDVLKGVARGLSNKEIGLELNLAEVTIKLHLSAVFRKIGARNRAEAAVLATKHGFGEKAVNK